jgi:hypothetical protein
MLFLVRWPSIKILVTITGPNTGLTRHEIRPLVQEKGLGLFDRRPWSERWTSLDPQSARSESCGEFQIAAAKEQPDKIRAFFQMHTTRHAAAA